MVGISEIPLSGAMRREMSFRAQMSPVQHRRSSLNSALLVSKKILLESCPVGGEATLKELGPTEICLSLEKCAKARVSAAMSVFECASPAACFVAWRVSMMTWARAGQVR